MKVVVFTSNNCRILYNPVTIAELAKLPNVVIDPDLSKVNGLAPHLWKLVNGEVVPLDREEITARCAHLEQYGADNTIGELNDPRLNKLKLQKSMKYKSLAVDVYHFGMTAAMAWLLYSKK